MSHQRALGAVLGLAAGLLTASSMLVGAYILVVFLFPILLAPPVLGVILGLKLARSGALPRWPWAGIVALAVVILPVAALSPYALAVAELQVSGRDIPLPPEARAVATRTNPFGSASAGPIAVRLFETPRSAGDVVSFYRETLTQSGWREVSAAESRAWFTKEGSHLFVETGAQDGQTAVVARRHVDLVWSPWLMLLATAAIIAVLLWRYRRKPVA